LLSEDQWYTPETPLLPGTMRQYLLNKNLIRPRAIYHFDLEKYDKLCVFNAMIPFGKIFIKSENIY
jgi:4-amino-4-deoxychorismate lyase